MGDTVLTGEPAKLHGVNRMEFNLGSVQNIFQEWLDKYTLLGVEVTDVKLETMGNPKVVVSVKPRETDDGA